jgi:plasmid maintenance system antidote protein VapI
MKKPKSKADRPPMIDDQLREAILAKGLTAYAAAKLAGVDPGVVNRFVKGERDLRFATAAKIAAALGLTLSTGG